MPNKELDGSRH